MPSVALNADVAHDGDNPKYAKAIFTRELVESGCECVAATRNRITRFFCHDSQVHSDGAKGKNQNLLGKSAQLDFRNAVRGDDFQEEDLTRTLSLARLFQETQSTINESAGSMMRNSLVDKCLKRRIQIV